MRLSKKLTILLSVTAILFSALILAGCGGSGSSTAASDGQTIFENKCGTCHPLTTATNQKHNEAEWKSVVARMQSLSNAISDSDAQAIVKYLTENYGE